MNNHIHIIGGGTFSDVRNHLSIAARGHGATARRLEELFQEAFGGWNDIDPSIPPVHLHLTRMANPTNRGAAVTNEHVAGMIDRMVADPRTRVIILNAALCDYHGQIGDVPSGSHAERLKTANGVQTMVLTPSDKLIGRIREQRKDILVVGFKVTTGATPDEQYRIGLDMLKRSSLNLVLANDTVTRNNMIIAPEETRYFETTDRDTVLRGLVQMVIARSTNTFTRSTVVEGKPVPWNSERVPASLRKVVDHCIARGAYRPFRGATAGHFAVKLDEGRILTSRRKTNFNRLHEEGEGLVEVEYEGDDRVVAYGAKPSVGGQSQRIVFREHPEVDCIVHAHVPLKPSSRELIPVAPQWSQECGSHQCGANTSRHLASVDGIKAVMLEDHGFNVVFPRTADPDKVIAFIEQHFDLDQKTGGSVA